MVFLLGLASHCMMQQHRFHDRFGTIHLCAAVMSAEPSTSVLIKTVLLQNKVDQLLDLSKKYSKIEGVGRENVLAFQVD